jgi:hypothetical protein
MLERYVVVVRRDDGFPTEFRSRRTNQHAANLFRDRPSGRVGVTAGEGGIVKIFSTLDGVGVEDTKPVVDGRRTGQMVAANGLAESPRPTVHREPKPVFLVRLDLDEMISAAERCKLDRAFLPADGFKAGMAQPTVGDALRLLNDHPPVSAMSRHRPAKIREDSSSSSRNIENCRIDVQGDG